MKIGQLVMLVKRDVGPLYDATFPPLGASGEVVCHCMGDVHVEFPNYPDPTPPNTWWHVPIPWLIKIDDPDAMKGNEDQLDLDLSDRSEKRIERELTLRELAKIGRRMLEEEDA